MIFLQDFDGAQCSFQRAVARRCASRVGRRPFCQDAKPDRSSCRGDDGQVGGLEHQRPVSPLAAADQSERAIPAVLLFDHNVNDQPALEPDPVLPKRRQSLEKRSDLSLGVARAAAE